MNSSAASDVYKRQTHDGVKKVYGDGSPGATTVKLYDALTGIQNETEEDVFGWLHPLP